jgi:hypothetical protein
MYYTIKLKKNDYQAPQNISRVLFSGVWAVSVVMSFEGLIDINFPVSLGIKHPHFLIKFFSLYRESL